jgi:hypothetical protein
MGLRVRCPGRISLQEGAKEGEVPKEGEGVKQEEWVGIAQRQPRLGYRYLGSTGPCVGLCLSDSTLGPP